MEAVEAVPLTRGGACAEPWRVGSSSLGVWPWPGALLGAAVQRRGGVSCFLEAALRSRRAGFALGALHGVAGVGSVGWGGGDGAAHLPPWTGEGTGNFGGFSRGLAALVRSVSPELPSFLCTCYGNSVLYVFATYKNSHEYLQMYPHR